MGFPCFQTLYLLAQVQERLSLSSAGSQLVSSENQLHSLHVHIGAAVEEPWGGELAYS